MKVRAGNRQSLAELCYEAAGGDPVKALLLALDFGSVFARAQGRVHGTVEAAAAGCACDFCRVAHPMYGRAAA